MPSVSVIIPAFNAAEFIVETLDSIYPQLEPRDEIIVIDDGSTDGTAEIVRGYSQTPSIRCLSQKNSGGPSAPRNKGISLARGDLIVLFDSDDVMHPNKLRTIKEVFAANEDAGLICSDFSLINESGEVIDESHLKNYDFYRTRVIAQQQALVRLESHEAILFLARENFVGTSSATIPRQLLEQVGGFRIDLRNAEDRELWLRIVTKYPLIFINQPLHSYRKRQFGNISSKRISLRAANKRGALFSHYINQKDPKVCRALHLSISDVIYAEAYDYFFNGEMPETRKALLRHGLSFLKKRHWRLLLKSMLGRRGAVLARRIKHHLLGGPPT